MEDYKKAIIDSLSIKVGDWTYGDVGDGFGQITQIIPYFLKNTIIIFPKGNRWETMKAFVLGL